MRVALPKLLLGKHARPPAGAGEEHRVMLVERLEPERPRLAPDAERVYGPVPEDEVGFVLSELVPGEPAPLDEPGEELPDSVLGEIRAVPRAEDGGRDEPVSDEVVDEPLLALREARKVFCRAHSAPPSETVHIS
ncbi:hypothetical protein J0H58_23960 [bacterium]|nr:hypothetical protein [bacterium]